MLAQTATAADRAAATAIAKRDRLRETFAGGDVTERALAHVLNSLSVWTDGSRRVVADVPDTYLGALLGRGLTTQVLDDASPEHFETAVIEQVSGTRAILHLAPLAGEVRY
jgi:hypothetical protein